MGSSRIVLGHRFTISEGENVSRSRLLKLLYGRIPIVHQNSRLKREEDSELNSQFSHRMILGFLPNRHAEDNFCIDIDTGQLAAVLQLLYALSTFKQFLKQKRKEEQAEKTQVPVITMAPSTASKYVLPHLA
ncbi:unnamed protein product [Angiostrongylus costaricensis]|uniref:GATOR complex protein NPRL3 n=1 Tax=Angiostrongylus costaricensis TaxID=334426 RepID=A0A0R3PPG5_ANGCS|nr:unnamed protein product [Angiostrongylus costaricensis]